jgi:hypothetical protein
MSPMPQRGSCTTVWPRTVALFAIRSNCQANRITFGAERRWSQRYLWHRYQVVRQKADKTTKAPKQPISG